MSLGDTGNTYFVSEIPFVYFVYFVVKGIGSVFIGVICG
jgi:hypothetical protein